jgi:hypothetical protein
MSSSSSSYQQAHAANAVLKGEQPSMLAGETSKYQSTGGDGYGFDGKEIKAGVMEFSSHKTGGSRRRKQRKSYKKRRGVSHKRRRSDRKRR